MMFKILNLAIFFTLAAAATPTSLRNLKQNCGGLSYSYTGDGTTLNSQKTDGNFNIPKDGSVSCTLSCTSGDAKLYIAFGAAGGPADAANNDALDTNAGCNKQVTATNTKGDNPGFRYTVDATNYVNLQITCACTTATTETSGANCFSGDTMVTVLEKGQIPMKELQLWDQVFNGRGYEPVYAFGHKKENEMADFVQIFHDGSAAPLEMTGEHFVFLQGKKHPCKASEVVIGDILAGSSVVTGISSVHKQGIYMPLTASGIIVVNKNVLASTYVSILEHAHALADHPWMLDAQNDIFHAWLAPLRMVCLGVSHQLCGSAEDGIHSWLLMGLAVVKLANELPFALQVILGYPLLGALGQIHMLEGILGASWAPLLFFITMGLLLGRRGRSHHKVA